MTTFNRSLFNSGLLFLALTFVQCKNENRESTPSEETNETINSENNIMKEDYGTTPEGEKVEQYTLRNQEGMEVKIITYGGRITSLEAPDRDGEYEDVVLGFDSLEHYTSENPYFGALIGRFGNRIDEGKFSLDGEEYTLAQNDGENHLHGGEKGFDKVVWNVHEEDSDSKTLVLSYVSEDMEEGYPGRLETIVTYKLNDDNSLDVKYEATTDKKTIVNLTQHSYFNLSGDFSEKILDHKVEINADEYVPVDETLIPTGELREVANTPFDFREPTRVGENIEADHEQIKRGRGFDHTWVLNGEDGEMKFAASALHPESGRLMEVYTTEPGMQFYTGNFLDGTLPQQYSDGTYERRTGFCFETQHFPDSPNQEGFPSVVLEPGEKYSSKTSFRFSVKE